MPAPTRRHNYHHRHVCRCRQVRRRVKIGRPHASFHVLCRNLVRRFLATNTRPSHTLLLRNAHVVCHAEQHGQDGYGEQYAPVEATQKNQDALSHLEALKRIEDRCRRGTRSVPARASGDAVLPLAQGNFDAVKTTRWKKAMSTTALRMTRKRSRSCLSFANTCASLFGPNDMPHIIP